MTVHAAKQLVWHIRAQRPLAAPAWLEPTEAQLFRRMAPADQFEGLAVMETLRQWGGDRDLLVAGLLHDVGKSLAPPGAGYRVLVTVLETIAPRVLPLLACRSEALRSLTEHAVIGGKMAADAGLPRDVVRLIAEHHQPSSDDRMMALQRADALH